MPQGDDQTSAMKEALKHGKNAVIAHLDAAEVLQPGVGAFDFPAFAIAPQLARWVVRILRGIFGEA
jgi:hypothetical protein